MFLTNSITSTGARAEFFDGVLAIDSTSHWSPYNLEPSCRSDNRSLWAAKRATALLNELEQALRRMNVEQLPPLHAVELEDHSLLFEWILPGRRASVALDPIPAQSGWYVLADDAIGKCLAWGDLSTLDWEKLINHMLTASISS
jgi:hypothetical protein